MNIFDEKWIDYMKKDSTSLIIWRDLYNICAAHYGLVECAECLMNAKELVPQNEEERQISLYFNERIEILFAAVSFLLNRKEAKKALSFLKWMSDDLLFIVYYKALAYYYDGQYDESAVYWKKYLDKFLIDDNENAMINEKVYFYLGNCLYKKNNISEAIEAYQAALQRRKSFTEAIVNMALIFREFGDQGTYQVLFNNKGMERFKQINDILMEPVYTDLLVDDSADDEIINNIPIFINSRDRVECLRKLINWLWDNDYRNIYVLDNASTYQPLLIYYQETLKNLGVNVLYLRKNMGHLALWKSGILEKLNVQTPFVYTDSDVVPIHECPQDCIKYFLRILRENLFIQKVGFGIKYDDITFYNKTETMKIEKRYWEYPIKEGQYFASVDTTFALYRNTRYYTFRESIRTGYPYMINHLPYYYDYENLPEDEKYYMDHANTSSTGAVGWKSK